jgi:thiamine pyrophosphokinase
VKTVVVLAGGPGAPAGLALPAGAVVIAADGGAELAPAVDLLVGDLDSVREETVARARRVERHPREKDATDLELALTAALRERPERILVVGGDAGRLDHLLGSLLLLGADAWAGVQLDARLGPAAAHVVRGERTLAGEPGELISLFALHGRAEGVVTEGLAYPLRGETLEPGSSRGSSNEFVERVARIAVARGVILALRPTGSAAAGTPS